MLIDVECACTPQCLEWEAAVLRFIAGMHVTKRVCAAGDAQLPRCVCPCLCYGRFDSLRDHVKRRRGRGGGGHLVGGWG